MNLTHLTPGEQLIYDFVVGPLYDIEGDGPNNAVSGRAEALNNIVGTLGPLTNLLLELWRSLASGDVVYPGGGTLHQTIEALPQPLVGLLDKLTSTTEEST